MKNKIISIISLGISLHWLSLFFSYHKLQNIDINQAIATGGFPLKVFEYPFPPMGHDWPPLETWPVFFMNLFIWLVFAWLIGFLIGKKMKKRNMMSFLAISAIVLSLLGIFYIMLKFD
jgi:hypothetical protein